MNTKYYIILMSLLCLVVIGCQNDIVHFLNDESATSFNSEIFGTVVDLDQNTVEGAKIVFGGNVTYSDKNGLYVFKNVKAQNIHNHMTISKDGYIAACKTFRVQKESRLRFKSVLTPMVFAHRISSSAGGIVKNNQVTLSFEPHSFVFDQDKSVYHGDVSIALNYLDPLELQTLETMPGDMSSINTSKELGSLTSFGMVHVELQASDGRKLQIKEGKYVDVSMALKDTHASAARSEVALWHFDYTTGLWTEAGTAVKENNQYKAKVPHFSWWTYGASYPSVTLSGRIVDKDGDPLTNIHVHVHPVGEYLGGQGIVNLDGTFSGAVPKNIPLQMTIQSYGIQCHNKQGNPKVIPIGTLSFKTDVGDIIFDSPALKKFRVKGSFTACNGSKIKDGWLNFYNEFHPIVDGKIDINAAICRENMQDITMIALDRVNHLSTDSFIVIYSTPIMDLGQIQICNTQANFISLKCPELNVDTIFHYGVGFHQLSGNTIWSEAGGHTLEIDFNVSPATTTIPKGTFTINESTFLAYDFHLETYESPESGFVEITSSMNTPGQRLTGKYQMRLKRRSDGKYFDFRGTFNVKI